MYSGVSLRACISVGLKLDKHRSSEGRELGIYLGRRTSTIISTRNKSREESEEETIFGLTGGVRRSEGILGLVEVVDDEVEVAYDWVAEQIQIREVR